MLAVILISLLSVIVYVTLWYWFAEYKKDLSVMDIAWGMGFVTIAIGLIASGYRTQPFLLVATLIVLWGLRLSWHIAVRRINKPEDSRYTKLRKSWKTNFALRSYLQLYLLQGLFIVIIAAPLFVATSQVGSSITLIQYFGIALWFIGLLIESVADHQLRAFAAKKPQPGTVLNKGLWAWSRHPNYFGEVLLWWGIWLTVSPFQYGPIAIISPLTISFLILFVSGVPMQENAHKHDPAYAKYRKKTSIFIPLPPAKDAN